MAVLCALLALLVGLVLHRQGPLVARFARGAGTRQQERAPVTFAQLGTRPLILAVSPGLHVLVVRLVGMVSRHRETKVVQYAKKVNTPLRASALAHLA